MTEGAMILANAGTPLLLGGAFYFIVLNAVLGVVEGTIIRFLTGGRWLEWVTVMVAANYVSAAAGVVLLDRAGRLIGAQFIGEPPIDGFRSFGIAMAVLIVIVTLAVESVVVVVALRFQKRPAGRALPALLAANVLSNAAMVAWFVWLSAVTIPPGIELVPAEQLARDPQAMLYWIDEHERLCEIPLAGGPVAQIANWRQSDLREHPVLKLDPQGNEIWLIARSAIGSKTLRSFHVGRAELSKAQLAQLFVSSGRTNHIDLQPDDARQLKAENGWWPYDGTKLLSSDGAVIARFAVEMPGYQHESDTHVLLPDGQVVLTLGDSICLYDIETNRIALLAKGRGPVVVPSAWGEGLD